MMRRVSRISSLDSASPRMEFHPDLGLHLLEDVVEDTSDNILARLKDLLDEAELKCLAPALKDRRSPLYVGQSNVMYVDASGNLGASLGFCPRIQGSFLANGTEFHLRTDKVPTLLLFTFSLPFQTRHKWVAEPEEEPETYLVSPSVEKPSADLGAFPLVIRLVLQSLPEEPREDAVVLRDLGAIGRESHP